MVRCVIESVQNELLERRALDSGRVGTWEWQIEQNEVTFSLPFRTGLGYENTTFQGSLETFLSFIHLDDRCGVSNTIAEARSSGSEDIRMQCRVNLRSGISHFITFRCKAVRSSEGAISGICGVCWDATEEANSSNELEHFAQIVESSQDAIFSKSHDGRILTWNTGATAIFGYSAEEMIGKSALQLFPKDRIQEQDMFMEKLQQGLGIYHFETVRLKKDGQLVDVSISISPMKDSTGREIGTSEVIRDISAQKKNQDKLAKADRRKDEFLATLSHELRNPLEPIKNGLQILKNNPGMRQSEEIQLIMTRQVEYLSRLVDDLLDVTRIGQGKIDIQPSVLSLKSVIDAAVETNRPVLTKKQHSISVEFENPDQELNGDRVRLVQVFGNLINNASKYMDEQGTIKISTRTEDGNIHVDVLDTGIGIPEDKLAKVFKLYFQVDEGSALGQGGLGLGLALSQKIVALHGGQITAESDGLGKGSVFSVQLPIGTISEPEVNVVEIFETPKAEKKLRILLVDDNLDSLRMLEAMVLMNNHEVATASCGLDAVEVAKTFRPHLAFVDIGLPDIDGRTVGRRIRAEEVDAAMLVALSGYGSELDRRQSLEAGFNYHLSKPAPIDILEMLMSEAADTIDFDDHSESICA